ncbi:MAG: TetR/AcrR family transcriptional regulator [Sphaerochaetaceae bacterium]|jgi:TetR/AcrR family transcriptional regulator|nr:TetR/AcrR family transcriptional regulator [Sphaerochaetaceae bacterium]
MPKKIDHDKRKDAILATALEVFSRDGYFDSNLSTIAEACNLSRATLYQYFSDKEDIFYCALKSITENMFQKYNELEWTDPDSPLDTIIRIVDDICKSALEYSREVKNLVSAITHNTKDYSQTVFRRTAKLQFLFRRLMNKGISMAQIRDCDVQSVVRNIVILVESFCFQLTFFGSLGPEQNKVLIHEYLESFRMA